MSATACSIEVDCDMICDSGDYSPGSATTGVWNTRKIKSSILRQNH